VALGVHFLSDIVAGAAIGIAVGLVAVLAYPI
jgi:membrane-associated phospholipid phosphatase